MPEFFMASRRKHAGVLHGRHGRDQVVVLGAHAPLDEQPSSEGDFSNRMHISQKRHGVAVQLIFLIVSEPVTVLDPGPHLAQPNGEFWGLALADPRRIDVHGGGTVRDGEIGPAHRNRLGPEADHVHAVGSVRTGRRE